ncbi:adenosine kinase [bacterium]|jgi:sugar/nucleoside kinase (ribokinase family)|nr:adenosine kinase [bacterium]MBT4251249.1 adenosine kinase [bacterium]MBT4598370.1 adenosine kinase [bacterium]MBT6754203.1 adenosine kinase [bacterium]MBT7038026.1 adenosine kinase [bacterium]
MGKKTSRRHDVIGIGSPLLDIVMQVDEDTLSKMNLKKGSMKLISKDESLSIAKETAQIKKRVSPGGSSANTISGANALGTETGFIGAVGDDEYGELYKKQTEDEGVTPFLHHQEESVTGHAFTFITPDGERTFATHLGAANTLEKEHIKEDQIKDAKFFHIEAYQLEDPLLCRALFHAIAIAKDAKTKISLDLSDAALINRNKILFTDVICEHVDVVFANEDEAREFTGKDNEEALDYIAKMCDVAVVKLGEKGSLIKSGEEICKISPCSVDIENTNGAGDMYAAGILHGLVKGLSLREAGELASHASSLVVASPGARIHEKHLDSIQKLKKESVKTGH